MFLHSVNIMNITCKTFNIEKNNNLKHDVSMGILKSKLLYFNLTAA